MYVTKVDPLAYARFQRVQRADLRRYAVAVTGRKRKVKCQLTDDNVGTCAECVKTGTQCTIQAPEAEQAGDGNVNSPAHASNPELESRLKRIESLLQRLVENQEQHKPAHGEISSESDPTTTSSASAAASIWNDIVRLIYIPGDEDLIFETKVH